jgi:peptide/nickel transport system substrate-binding protein
MGRIRLQVAIAALAIVALIGGMVYVAFSVTTVTVPDYGGTYVEGLAGNPQAINPLLSQSNPVDRDLSALIFNGLTRSNDKGEIVPDLAESWDISSDGKTYTFHLRHDVVWHDGAPFNADDVTYTVSVLQSPDFPGSPYLADMWRSVTLDKLDDYTLTVTLREPFAPFLDYTTVGILPAHILSTVPVSELANSQFNAAPIGTGPFMVSEVSARQVVLITNSNFYRPRPYLDRIEFVFYPNDQAVLEGRSRAEISGIGQVLPEDISTVAADDGLVLYSAPIASYNLVYLNLDRVIFQDRNVRRAMMYALDRQKLVDDVLGGQGVVIDSPILPNSWAYDTEVPHYEQNLQEARKLLESAGWYDDDGDGVRERGDLKLEFTLVTNDDDPVRVQLIQAISDQLAQVGIHAIPQTVSWEDLVSQMLRLRRFDAVLSGWANLSPDPDPYPYWHSSQANEDGSNLANYINQEADSLLEEARSTHDRDQRIELYRQFQELFAYDVPSLLLYQPVYSYAVDATIHDVQVGPMNDSSDRFQTVSSWYIATQRMLLSQAREQGIIEEDKTP